MVSNHFRVQAIVWNVGADGVDNDAIVLKDKNGVVKYAYTLNIATAGEVMAPPASFLIPILFDGLIVHTLARGTVYIYLADNNNLKA